MDMKVKIRDRRNPGWYYINNEVYDSAPSCEALAIYNAIARYANNETERAYFSGKKWKRHHKVGHSKLAQGMRWLIDMKLIAATGNKTRDGAVYFDLLTTDHLKKSEHGGVSPQNRGCFTSEHGGVSPQNTNYTKKIYKEQDTLTLTPPTFENTKTSKKVPSDKDKAKLDEIKKIGEPVFDLLTELGFEKMNKSKEMCELVARAVKECGVDFVLRGVRGRVKSHEGKDPYWRFFFKDTVQISTAAASVKQSSGGGFNKVWQEAI